MADDHRDAEKEAFSVNSTNRDALRRAADDLLKADRAARRAEGEPDETALSDASFGAEGDDGEDAVASIAHEIAAIQAENADMKDRLLRLAADMENLRRRTQREVADSKSFAIANFARDMLGVSDNLRRALEAVTSEQREAADETLKNLLEGVELTEKAMLATMERHGVVRLSPEGERFDPHFHQAMFEVPNPDLPNNTVVQVVQAGYRIGERMLRPAMVGVAKGGPKAPSGEAEPGAPNPEAEKDA